MTVRRQTDSKTGKEFWLVDVDFELPDGRRKRVRKVSPVQTKRGAEEYERQLRGSLLSGERGTVAAEVPTLAAFAPDFLAKYAAVHNRPVEQRTKELALKKHLLPAFGRTRLDRITVKDVDGFKAARLKEGYAPKSINIYLGVLRKMLAVAVEWGQLDKAPAIKPLRVPRPEFDFLSFDEAERLVAAADPEWRPMIVLGLEAGLRQGELLGLRWVDVDFKTRRLVVRKSHVRGHTDAPKSGKSREVDLTDRALDALRDQQTRTRLKGELVFCDETGGNWEFHKTHAPLWRACRRAGIREIGWHDLRHTFASHLVMLGTPIKAVQELLGHASSQMTDRYAHLTPDVRRDAIRRLSERGSGKMTARQDRDSRKGAKTQAD